VTGGEVILTSSDGRILDSKNSRVETAHLRVAYGSGVFAAAADNGAILTSPDGSEWTPRDSGTHLAILTIVHGKERFLAAGEEGVLLSI